MKSGATQTFHFNQHLADKQENKKSTKMIPILRSSLGLHQMKTIIELGQNNSLSGVVQGSKKGGRLIQY